MMADGEEKLEYALDTSLQTNDDSEEDEYQPLHGPPQDYNLYLTHRYNTSRVKDHIERQRIRDSVCMVVTGVYEQTKSRRWCRVDLCVNGSDHVLSEEKAWEIVTTVAKDHEMIPFMNTISVVGLNIIVFDFVSDFVQRKI